MTRQQAIKILRLLENQNPSIHGIHSAMLMAIKAIRHEPVKCKDCKHWNENECSCEFYDMGSKNWYCADGERRER